MAVRYEVRSMIGVGEYAGAGEGLPGVWSPAPHASVPPCGAGSALRQTVARCMPDCPAMNRTQAHSAGASRAAVELTPIRGESAVGGPRAVRRTGQEEEAMNWRSAR